MTSPEFEIVKLCVRIDNTDDAAKEAEEIIQNHNIDWDDLYARADYHSVRPQLARLTGGILSELIPERIRERISNAYSANLYDQLSYAGEFLEIKKILDKAGIQAVPYKGFWLAHEMYGNMADRESVDIDLFIHFRDLDKVMPLMTERGYGQETSDFPVTPRK